MVRLMHSMVVFQRPEEIRQMGHSHLRHAGAAGPTRCRRNDRPVPVAARRANRGRTEFTAEERAVVEFARYRCFLLGLPEELLPAEPNDIIHVMHARSALLRHGFDSICGELVRGTMSAYLRPGTSVFDRCADAVEKSFSKLTFVRTFCNGDREIAEAMGVTV